MPIDKDYNIAVGFCGTAYGAVRGFWPLNDAFGGSDVSGRGNDATITGLNADATTASANLYDTRGYTFTGIAGNDVRITNNGDLYVSRDFSLFFYLRAPFPVTSSFELLGWKATYPGNDESVHVALNDAGAGSWKIDVTLYDNATGARVGPDVHTATSPVINDVNTWLPVSIVYKVNNSIFSV